MAASNRKSGGGGVSGLTANQLLFGGSDGLIAQSSDLTWNNTTKTLTLAGADADQIINASSGNVQLDLQKAGVSVLKLRSGTSSVNIEGPNQFVYNSSGAGGSHLFSANGADRMEIGSAGDVAIGVTTDANYRLKVSKNTSLCQVGAFATASQAVATFRAVANASETEMAAILAGANDATSTLMGVNRASGAFFYGGSAQTSVVIGGVSASSALIFAPGNAERMRITSGGLVGIGATPAAGQHLLVDAASAKQVINASSGNSVFEMQAGGSAGLRITHVPATSMTIAEVAGLGLGIDSGGTIRFNISSVERLRLVSGNGDIVIGNGGASNPTALATNATAGFLRITTSAGPPTGAAVNGAIHIDTTNSRLYARIGGAWVSTALA